LSQLYWHRGAHCNQEAGRRSRVERFVALHDLPTGNMADAAPHGSERCWPTRALSVIQHNRQMGGRPWTETKVPKLRRLHRPTQLLTECGLTRVVDIDLAQFQLQSSCFGWTNHPHEADSLRRFGPETDADLRLGCSFSPNLSEVLRTLRRGDQANSRRLMQPLRRSKSENSRRSRSPRSRTTRGLRIRCLDWQTPSPVRTAS
jgi:hypothetical protein